MVLLGFIEGRRLLIVTGADSNVDITWACCYPTDLLEKL